MKYSFDKINFNSKNISHHILQFVNIANNCNRIKIANAFVKFQSLPPQISQEKM